MTKLGDRLDEDMNIRLSALETEVSRNDKINTAWIAGLLIFVALLFGIAVIDATSLQNQISALPHYVCHNETTVKSINMTGGYYVFFGGDISYICDCGAYLVQGATPNTIGCKKKGVCMYETTEKVCEVK